MHPKLCQVPLEVHSCKQRRYWIADGGYMVMIDSDAPELVGLQTDLRDSINELRTKVQPLLEKVCR
jgi:hypothetical protein